MRSLIGGVAATAAVRVFPFRVFNFPSQPKLYVLTPEMLRQARDFLLTQHWGDSNVTYATFKSANGNTVKLNAYPSRYELMLGGPNLAYDGPVYG